MISEFKNCICGSNNKVRTTQSVKEMMSEGVRGLMTIQFLKCNDCGTEYKDNLEFIPCTEFMTEKQRVKELNKKL